MVRHAIYCIADDGPTIATNCHLHQPISKSVLHPKNQQFPTILYIQFVHVYTTKNLSASQSMSLPLCIKPVNTNITYYFKEGTKSQILLKQKKTRT
jgi:hypothetical protein